MDDTNRVATLIDSTTSKIEQLQRAFSELECYRAISLNVKWRELEEHFRGLDISLKKRNNELDDEEKEYKIRASEAQKALEKQEAVVIAKEQASLEQLQVKRDDAFSVIRFSIENSMKSPPSVMNAMSSGCRTTIIEENPDIKDYKVNSPVWNGISDKGNISPLFKLCREMDAKGLHKFISDNRKNLASIRKEIPAALRISPNSFCLVLDCLKDFYAMNVSMVDVKTDSSILGMRRTCLMLMESLYIMLIDVKLGCDSTIPVINSDIKDMAKSVAGEWKPKLGGLDIGSSNGNSLEVHAFLQLLATFDIVSDFSEDEICNLIPSISRRRQTADLCHSLGLSRRMPGLIQELVNSGRHIEAVNLAYVFQLSQQFNPVALLKAYLKESRKASLSDHNGTTETELSALKSIIKCIEEHKLNDQYPIDPLQKRLLHLEKAKDDKRRSSEVNKHQSKRSRANANAYNSNGCGPGARVTNLIEKNFYKPSDRLPHAYDWQYVYQSETHTPVAMKSHSYNLPPNHGGYYGNSYKYHHQPPYIH